MAPASTSPRQGPPLAKAGHAAEDFEALLLTQLLKGMRRTVPEVSASSSARDPYHELHDEMLAMPLARNGGIGLAAMIRAYLDWSPTPGAGSHTPAVGEKGSS